mmetsp:Transcript_14740/g.34503  ORF Transcript_14740/g.34503 Transcript_14740/m.34503 type:complete len:287 (-) Transcript_14740:1738-2598(-)
MLSSVTVIEVLAHPSRVEVGQGHRPTQRGPSTPAWRLLRGASRLQSTLVAHSSSLWAALLRCMPQWSLLHDLRFLQSTSLFHARTWRYTSGTSGCFSWVIGGETAMAGSVVVVWPVSILPIMRRTKEPPPHEGAVTVTSYQFAVTFTSIACVTVSPSRRTSLVHAACPLSALGVTMKEQPAPLTVTQTRCALTSYARPALRPAVADEPTNVLTNPFGPCRLREYWPWNKEKSSARLLLASTVYLRGRAVTDTRSVIISTAPCVPTLSIVTVITSLPSACLSEMSKT